MRRSAYRCGLAVLVPALVLVLVLAVAGTPERLRAQSPGADRVAAAPDLGFRLEQNYPNPFNPSTRIPFYLDADLIEAHRPVRVTIRIYDILQRLVAIPTALNHPRGNGMPVNRLGYATSGRHEAYWDGRDLRGREVASGIYIMRIDVKGQTQFRKMVVLK